MKKFLQKAGPFLRRVLDWLAPADHLALAALGLAFLVSLGAWSLGDRLEDATLYFPSYRTGSLRGETRALPRVRGAEARAELVASELLLGPGAPGLLPAFPAGVRVESSLYRKGRLYLDLSEDAALSGRADLERGLSALRRSVKAALPLAKGVVVTIGGRLPYADYPEPEPPADGPEAARAGAEKKGKKN